MSTTYDCSMTAPSTQTLLGLTALQNEVTDEDLNADGRYFCDTSFRDLTQCPHGDTGRYGNDADGKAIALLWNAWRAGEFDALRKAAEGMAEALNLGRELTEQDNLENAAGWDAFHAATNSALAAYEELKP